MCSSFLHLSIKGEIKLANSNICMLNVVINDLFHCSAELP
jgi:hypothetical protein